MLQLKYPTISYTNKLYEGNKKTLLTQTLHRKTLKLLRKIKNIFKPVAATNLASLGRSLWSYFVTIIRTLYLFQWNICRNLDCHRSRRQTNFFFLHIYARSNFTWNEARLVSSNSKSFFFLFIGEQIGIVNRSWMYQFIYTPVHSQGRDWSPPKIEHLNFWWQPSFYTAFYFNFVITCLYFRLYFLISLFSISFFNYNW